MGKKIHSIIIGCLSVSLILVLVLAFFWQMRIFPSRHKHSLTILTWNVRNLYMSKAQKTAYLKNGQIPMFLDKKLGTIAQVIKTLPALPDIIAFQEMGQESLLNYLLQRYFHNFGYRYIVYNNFMGRIHVALLSLYKPRKVIFLTNANAQYLRGCIEFHFQFRHQVWVLFANHWKSLYKTKISLVMYDHRQQSHMIQQRINLLKKQGIQHFIILGDFNWYYQKKYNQNSGLEYIFPQNTSTSSSHKNSSLSSGKTNSSYTQNNTFVRVIVDPKQWRQNQNSFLDSSYGQGSFPYHGKWVALDHILVSRAIGQNGTITCQVVSLPPKGRRHFFDHRPLYWHYVEKK